MELMDWYIWTDVERVAQAALFILRICGNRVL